MEVVVSFTAACHNSNHTFSRANVLVIWACSPHVSEAIDRPGHVQIEGVSQCIGNEKCIGEALIPEVARNSYRYYHVEEDV